MCFQVKSEPDEPNSFRLLGGHKLYIIRSLRSPYNRVPVLTQIHVCAKLNEIHESVFELLST